MSAGGGVKELHLGRRNGRIRVLAVEVDAGLLRVTLNVLCEAVRHASKRQGCGHQSALLSHLKGAVGSVVRGLAAIPSLSCIGGAVAGGNRVLLAVYDLYQIASDAVKEEAFAVILNLALQVVPLAQAVCHSHLFSARLE